MQSDTNFFYVLVIDDVIVYISEEASSDDCDQAVSEVMRGIVDNIVAESGIEASKV